MALKLVPPTPDRDPAYVAAAEALDASDVGRAFNTAERELRAAEDEMRAARLRVAAAKAAFYPARDAWLASPEVAALNATYAAAVWGGQ
jgi:hypothetical protein